jgi:alkanesulfonate monooxygenase SsuD/methylene tetrahydromethanopterin reductase-like flavin-dependent oxidoreductase (luciferase family)
VKGFNVSLGFKIDGRPGEDLADLARKAESDGFSELWVCEDLGLAGGISQVVRALSSTERMRVGLGIAPAAARNVAYLAMELATIMRMFPSRFIPGIGHGMPNWLAQVGARPNSLMTCLEEVASVLPALVDGDCVSFAGDHVHLDRVQLLQPPDVAAELSLGIRGPKGIALAEKLDAGLILAEGSVPDYIADVRQQVGQDCHLTVFAWANLNDADPATARADVDAVVRSKLQLPMMANQLHGSDGVALALSDVAIVGSTEQCRTSIERLLASGANSVILQPVASSEETQMGRFANLARAFQTIRIP